MNIKEGERVVDIDAYDPDLSGDISGKLKPSDLKI